MYRIQKENKGNGELVFVTRLRAISCIAIVILHTFYAAMSFATGSAGTAALSIRNLMLWAVPCFVMITGTLLLDPKKEIPYKKLFRKYILRIVLAIVIFCVLLASLDDIAGKSFGIATIGTGLKAALTGESWSHMWYLYMILAIYLTLPFSRKIAGGLQRKDANYLLLIYGIFLAVLPFVEALTGTKTGFYICVYSVYPFYLFCGYLIAREIIVKFSKWFWLLLSVLGTAAMLVFTILSQTKEWGTLASQLTKYTCPIVLVQSVGIFGLMYTCTPKTLEKSNWFHRALRQIDRCSFGIYLIHMIFLKLVFVWIGFDPYQYGGLCGTGIVAGITVVVFAVTFLCVWLLKKIPGVRWLL